MTGSLFTTLAAALEKQAASDWRSIARPSQLPPGGSWTVWLVDCGRGWGKTRTGAETVRERVERQLAKRIALIAPTMDDARAIMVEGESGLLAISPDWYRPEYEPSKRRLTWPNGAIATLFSADEPERLRGPQHDFAWCDEVAVWRFPSAWDNLMLGLRVGKNPQAIVTTTPRSVKLIRDLLKREGKGVVITRGTTYENRENLAPTFFESIVGRYEGTRLGRQELNAELLEDVPGALWQRDKIDELRVSSAPARLTRIVVAIDPAVTSGPDADETGIVVAALGQLDRHGYVLEDLSGRYPPHVWARKAADAYHRHKADRVIAETNNGGEMVEATLRMVDPSVAYKAIHASRGKIVRAEPVAALYEQSKVHHVGSFPQLEDQQCSFSADTDRSRGSSPDRVDALVWALSELMVDGRAPMIITQAHLDWARGAPRTSPRAMPLAPRRLSQSEQDAANRYTGPPLGMPGSLSASTSFSDMASPSTPAAPSAPSDFTGSISASDLMEKK